MERQIEVVDRTGVAPSVRVPEFELTKRHSLALGWLAKRAFDILVSLVTLALFSPLFTFVGLLIKLDSPGPLFYHGKRIGKDGKPFWMHKFRTMRDVPVDTGPRVTACDDPRITRLGHILRDTKLNEFPQFLNVLAGEMSLVGPRPEDKKYVDLYTDEQRRVLSVPPGITSVASVLYHDEERMLCQDTLEDTYVNVIMPDKLNLDLAYVDRRSFLVDLDILFRTFLVLLPRFAQAVPDIEDLLFGPVQSFVRRRLSWFTLDLLASAGAVLIAHLVWWDASRTMHTGWFLNMASMVWMVLTFTFMNQVWGLQRHAWSCARGQEVVDILLSTTCATVVLLVVNALGFGLPLEMVMLCGFFSFVSFTTARYRSRLLTGLLWRWRCLRGNTEQSGQVRVLIVGAGDVGQFCARQFRRRPEGQQYQVVGFADDDLSKRGMRIQGTTVLGSTRAVPILVAQHGIDLVVVATPDLAQHECPMVLDICRHTVEQVAVIPDLLAFMVEPNQRSVDRTGQRVTEVEVSAHEVPVH